MKRIRFILFAVAILSIVTVCYAPQTSDGSAMGVSIDSCYFDTSTETLSFEGSAEGDLIKLYVEDLSGTRVTSYHSYVVRNGYFEGLMDVSHLDAGEYVLVAFQNAYSGEVQTARVTINLDSNYTPATDLLLDRDSVTITATNTVVLTATVFPVGADDTVVWSSSNSNFVEIDQDGRLTAKLYTAGQYVTVTATAGRVSAVCLVNVDYASTTMSPSSVSITQDSTRRLTVEIPLGLEGQSVVWKAESSHVSIDASGSSATIRGEYVGSTTVTAVVGGLYKGSCSVTVTEKPVTSNIYTFFLRIDSEADAQKASYGRSGLTADDLLAGITLEGTGPNAGAALQSCLKARNITCSFWSGGEIKYWVDQILGLKQIQYANGDWKYWIQYKDGHYNDWTLGWYTDGGNFTLLYGITSEDGQIVDPSIHENESPSNTTTVTNPDNSTTTTTTVTNPDGSTVITVETLKTEDGPNGSKILYSDKEVTFKDPSGEIIGVVKTKTETVTNRDGFKTISSTETVLDASGNIEYVIERNEKIDKTGYTIQISETLKNGEGNKISSFVEEFGPETTYTDTQGNRVKETSSVKTESDSTGMTAVTNKTIRTWKTGSGTVTVTDTERIETNSDGLVTVTVTKETVTATDSDTTTVVETKITDPEGRVFNTLSATIVSWDPSIRTVLESQQDGVSIVTTVTMIDGCLIMTEGLTDTILSQREKLADMISEETEAERSLILRSSEYGFIISFENGSISRLTDPVMTIVSSGGSVIIDASMLNNLKNLDDLTVSFLAASESDLTEAQRSSALPGSTFISIKIMSGEESIGGELGGIMTVLVNHQPGEGMEPVAYHLGDDGSRTRVASQGYDCDNGRLWMELSHLSVYEIADESPTSDEDGGDLLILYVLIGGALAALVTYLVLRSLKNI